VDGAVEHLRRDEAWSPDWELEDLLRARKLRETEIDDLDPILVPTVEQDVLRLDVAVGDVLRVDVSQRDQYLL